MRLAARALHTRWLRFVVSCVVAGAFGHHFAHLPACSVVGRAAGTFMMRGTPHIIATRDVSDGSPDTAPT